MIMIDVFDAIDEGMYNKFIEFYNGDITTTNQYTTLSLLQYAVLNDKNEKDKVKIIKFLIREKIDVNYTDKEDGRNALHDLYFSNSNNSMSFLMSVTKLLVKQGIDLNAKDRYGAIPLQYLISNNNLTTEELKELYMYLLKKGSLYKQADNFGNNCLHYAKEFSWRNGFLDIVAEFENSK